MSQIHYDREGVVFDIQRYSIHDGPGIRTIVFLKGCPLSCRWCCNPESQNSEGAGPSPNPTQAADWPPGGARPAGGAREADCREAYRILNPVLMYQPSKCLKCGKCVEVCGVKALSFKNPDFVDRSRCVGCGKCADVCPTQALTLKGRRMSVWAVMKELRKDATHYRRSGGGITLSGGEPLVQSEFAKDLLKACREQGWSTAMETTGYADPAVINDVMPLVDHALVDIKAIDPRVHEANTGVHNRRILENALRIASLTQTVVRVPVVPGVNADPQSIAAIGRFAKLMPGVDTVHLLPYHTFGENKYDLLNRPYPMGATQPLSKQDMAPLVKVIEELGLSCMIGG